MEPTILFLGKNKNLVVAKTERSYLKEIFDIKHVSLDERLPEIILGFEDKYQGPELTFKVKNYGGTIPIKHYFSPDGEFSISGEHLVNKIEGLFSCVRDYARQHGTSNVVLQNLRVDHVTRKTDHKLVYSLTGHAQLVVQE